MSTTTPSSAIRAHCLWCCNGSRSEVLLCPARRCPLWTLRLKAKYLPDKATLVDDPTPLYPLERPMTLGELVVKGSKLAAIRRRCIDCSGGSAQDAKACQVKDCALWPYRGGHNPALVGKRGRGNPAALARFRAIKVGGESGGEVEGTQAYPGRDGSEVEG
jgi:hypothetical protein